MPWTQCNYLLVDLSGIKQQVVGVLFVEARVAHTHWGKVESTGSLFGFGALASMEAVVVVVVVV